MRVRTSFENGHPEIRIYRDRPSSSRSAPGDVLLARVYCVRNERLVDLEQTKGFDENELKELQRELSAARNRLREMQCATCGRPGRRHD